MAKARQGIKRTIKAVNKNSKYKMKYTYTRGQTARNGKVNNRYTYRKQISRAKKYSYKG